MGKWLKRFTAKADGLPDTPDTLASTSIVSVPSPQPSSQNMPIVSTVSGPMAHDWEKYQELYQERAAIMQHYSGWSDAEANHWGLQEAVFAWVRDHHPHVIPAISGSFPAARYAGTQGPTVF